MTILFVILIILASVVLGLIVLIQNPKGGGLTGSIAGFSNQFMGVKQTTDVLEKGTWIFAAVVGLLCLLSAFFITGNTSSGSVDSKASGASVPAATQPATQPAQLPSNTVPLDSPAK
ncbi:preprotein translocase subunit SecG [Terrimonas pollutisoli]|uniref:preprotein translocase subunit SecG n=1 Tax=Terrimonas pollutisoli TaxID=3034147 RepID=UPI0023ED4AA6|nr:preprotein translocase subunit SecG [Terrimonas sp. H1YJ31]